MIANPQSLTLAEYLVWEAAQPLKYEYIDGKVYAMTGGNLPHNGIALNCYSQLRPHLRERGCRVNVADVKVQVAPEEPYFYPDLVVSCDERDRQALEAIAYPCLIVEVLSPSTASFDRGEKFKFYRRLPTLREYVLIEADKVGVDCYRKNSAGKWELTAYPEEAPATQEPILEFVSLDFRCPLMVLYQDVALTQGGQPL
jgi:Uma2 family endonuclease